MEPMVAVALAARWSYGDVMMRWSRNKEALYLGGVGWTVRFHHRFRVEEGDRSTLKPGMQNLSEKGSQSASRGSFGPGIVQNGSPPASKEISSFLDRNERG